MIKSVEIISGGASATYGADAIGGVSNFILRRDFVGFEADSQYSTTQAGDGQEVRASAIMGTKIADGRGNIVFATEYYDRKAAYEKNRSFFTDSWKDPSVGGNFIGFVFGANGYNPVFNTPSQAVLTTIVKPTGGTDVVPYGSLGFFNGLRFNPDGSIFDPAGANIQTWKGVQPNSGDLAYSTVNAYDNTLCNSTTCGTAPSQISQLKYNETEGYASSPQTRYSFMASGKYALTDSISAFSSARFAQSRTTTFLAGTNASYGWEATVPYNATTDSPIKPGLDYTDQTLMAQVLANPTAAAYANPGFIAHGTLDANGKALANHPVPVQMAMLLNSRGDPTAGWVMETYPLNSFGRRATVDTNTSWQIESGLNFQLPVKDWTGELYYSRGETATYNVAYGNNSLARWRGEITANDYGYHSSLQSNADNSSTGNGTGNGLGSGVGAAPGFGSVAVPCTSGFYSTIFNGDAVPTADCQYAVQAPLQTRTENQQDIFEANFQGGLVNLPAGEVRAR